MPRFYDFSLWNKGYINIFFIEIPLWHDNGSTYHTYYQNDAPVINGDLPDFGSNFE